MALLTIDQVIAALAGARRLRFFKEAATAKGSGFWHSLWKTAGSPAAGATPASGNGAIPTDATTGAHAFANPSAGQKSYLEKLVAAATAVGIVQIYDRLWANSGLSGTSVALQSFTQPALARHTDGEGNEIWLEVYTALGATGTTFTVKYTNQDGTTARTATLAYSGGAPVAGQLIGPFPLQDGDTGVRKIESVQLSISTGTAGDFGAVLLHPHAAVAIDTAGKPTQLDVLQTGHAEVADDACLALMVLASGASTGIVQLTDVVLAQG